MGLSSRLLLRETAEKNAFKLKYQFVKGQSLETQLHSLQNFLID